jgi:hypothetical protein
VVATRLGLCEFHVPSVTLSDNRIYLHGVIVLRKRSVTCVFTSVDLPTYMWTAEYATVYQQANSSLHAEQLPCMSSVLVAVQRNARYDV